MKIKVRTFLSLYVMFLPTVYFFRGDKTQFQEDKKVTRAYKRQWDYWDCSIRKAKMSLHNYMFPKPISVTLVNLHKYSLGRERLCTLYSLNLIVTRDGSLIRPERIFLFTEIFFFQDNSSTTSNLTRNKDSSVILKTVGRLRFLKRRIDGFTWSPRYGLPPTYNFLFI